MPAAARSCRGSGSPLASFSDSASTGSSASHQGSERSCGPAEIRLCRCVVPLRGSPAITIGGSISTCAISGCRFSRSSSSRRFFKNPCNIPKAVSLPTGDRAGPSRSARVTTSSPTCQPSSPKSWRPVASIAWSVSAAGSSAVAAAIGSSARTCSRNASGSRGFARSSIRISSGIVAPGVCARTGARPRRADAHATRSAAAC